MSPTTKTSSIAGVTARRSVTRSRASVCEAAMRPPLPAPAGAHPLARSSSIRRSGSLRVSEAARANSARASSLPPEALQQVAADAREQVVAAERALVEQAVDELQPGRRAERHRDRDRAVELDDRRRARPARARRRAPRSAPSRSPPACAPARGTRRSRPAACTARARRRARSARSSAARPRRISSRSQRAAVLVEQQDRLAVRADPGRGARRLDLHQRHEPVHLGLLRRELGQDPAEAQRLVAQRRGASSRRRRWPSSPR